MDTEPLQNYLDKQGTRGGFCEQWVNGLLKDALADREASGLDRATADLIARAGRSAWHDDPPPEQPDLFYVAGCEIERSYAFADPAVPGNFRRVSGRWASRIVTSETTRCGNRPTHVGATAQWHGIAQNNELW